MTDVPPIEEAASGRGEQCPHRWVVYCRHYTREGNSEEQRCLTCGSTRFRNLDPDRSAS